MTNIKESMIQNRVRETESRIEYQRDINSENSVKWIFYNEILKKWSCMDFREKKIRIVLMHMKNKMINVCDLEKDICVSSFLIGVSLSHIIFVKSVPGIIMRVKPDEVYYLLDNKPKIIPKNYLDYITDYLDYHVKSNGDVNVNTHEQRSF